MSTSQFAVLGCRFRFAAQAQLAHYFLGRLYGLPSASGEAASVFSLELLHSSRGGWQIVLNDALLDSRPTLATALRSLEYAVCLQVIRHRADWLVLHGATVVAPSGTLLIAGESGAGKTTLTLALAGRGYGIGGDDIVFLDPRADTLWPLPRCFHLDRSSRQLLKRVGVRLPRKAAGYGFVTPADVGTWKSPLPPVRNVLYLSAPKMGSSSGGGGPPPMESGRWCRSHSREPVLEPMSQAAMVLRLQAEAGWEGLPPPESMRALGRLASRAACWSLLRGPLQATSDAVAALIAQS